MKKGLLFIIAAGIMWGTSCVFLNFFKPYGFSSAQMTAMRMCFAFLLMLLYCLIFKRDALKIKLKDVFLYAICGLTLYATAAFYYEAMILTSSSTAVVLMYISPVPVMIFSVLAFGEKFNLKKGIAVPLMLVGCVLVAGVIGDFKPDTLGIIMGLLSAASYAIYNIFSKLESRRSIDPFTCSLYAFMFAAIASIAFCKPWEMPALIAQAPLTIVPMFVLHASMTCLLPYLLYSISLKYLSVGIASSLSIIEPMTGALLGFILYGDNLTAPVALGILMVVGSVFLLGFSESASSGKFHAFVRRWHLAHLVHTRKKALR